MEDLGPHAVRKEVDGICRDLGFVLQRQRRRRWAGHFLDLQGRGAARFEVIQRLDIWRYSEAMGFWGRNYGVSKSDRFGLSF